MKKVRGLLGMVALLGASMASAQVTDMPGGPAVNQLNLHEGVTQIAHDIYDLHWMIMIICTVIFVGVFGVMLYSIVMHRKSRGYKAAKFEENIGIELTWTIIPFLIIVGMAIPTTRTVVAMKDTSSADLTVKVTGYQWRWGYEYVDGPAAGVEFLSTLATPREQIEGLEPRSNTYLMEVDKPLVVPVDKKIRIVLTAERDHRHRFEAAHAARRACGADRGRRDPLLDGARLRRQAGRGARLPARHLVPR